MLVAFAFLIDMLVGDPPRPTHPVVIMGRAISLLERLLRPICGGSRSERVAGVILASVVTAGAYLASSALLRTAHRLSPVVWLLLNVWLLSTTLAGRGLSDAARAVYVPLISDDQYLARQRLSMIVGRDAQDLPVEEIVRATVETVAENTSDGVVAPLLFAFAGGAPLALAYKAVNTLDSMVGYRDARYVDFGWASARLDDLVNLVPARITGVLLVAAAAVLGEDWQRGWRVLLRDGRKHPSPNSGLGEAAMAGALRVRLGGLNTYKGQPSFRDYLGDELDRLEPMHIERAVKMMYGASSIAVVAGALVSAAILLGGG
jgi:adenosylcobinamide-phosphate synthase